MPTSPEAPPQGAPYDEVLRVARQLGEDRALGYAPPDDAVYTAAAEILGDPAVMPPGGTDLAAVGQAYRDAVPD